MYTIVFLVELIGISWSLAGTNTLYYIHLESEQISLYCSLTADTGAAGVLCSLSVQCTFLFDNISACYSTLINRSRKKKKMTKPLHAGGVVSLTILCHSCYKPCFWFSSFFFSDEHNDLRPYIECKKKM